MCFHFCEGCGLLSYHGLESVMHIQLNVLVTFLLLCHDQGKLKKEEFIWLIVPEEQESIMVGEAWQPEQKAESPWFQAGTGSREGNSRWARL